MPDINFLQDLMVLFGMGTLMVVAFHRLNLPPVLGFLTTGVICGPYGFKLIDDIHPIEALAEIGLVLLLFEAGIEFSVSTFMRLKKFLLVAGGLQLGLTVAATAAIAQFTGTSWPAAVFLGMLVSLSSTAIVLRILEHRGDIQTTHGRSAFSILIFQDLCIVPFVLLTPFLGGKGGSLHDVGLLTGKAILFLLLAATVARYLVPWLLSQVAKTKKREAFVLSIILLCLGTATATSHFGLSMALGAFIAGLIISESKFNHQALGEILPFREVFNCLVFVSIGMLFDLRVLLANPGLVFTCLALVLAVKTLIGAGVTRLAGHSLSVAILTGVTISQVSEFSFVLAKVGLSAGIIDPHTNQIFLAVAILSMFLTPALMSGGEHLTSFLAQILPAKWMNEGKVQLPANAQLENHTIIVGYSVAGKKLAETLSSKGLPHLVIDNDPDLVRESKSNGVPIFFGDASRQEILNHAGVSAANLIVYTIADTENGKRCVELARRLNPKLKIMVRCKTSDETNDLLAVGAQEVVAEDQVTANELSLRMLAHHSATTIAAEMKEEK